MRWRFVILACATVGVAALPTVLASEGIDIWWVSEPTMNPSPVEAGQTAEVAFSVGVFNVEDFRSCREALVTGLYGFPVCAYLLQWTISLDGDWLTEGSTPVGSGFMPYVRTLHEGDTVTTVDVTERVRTDVRPGKHTLHVQVNWIAGVPVSDGSGVSLITRLYPCGVDEQVDIPVMRCSYRVEGWQSAPVTEVEVLPSTTLNLFDVS